MADADLRELERRFRASGSTEDEAAWLRARLRGGELSQARVRLAAYLGHDASRLILGPSAAPVPADPALAGRGLGPLVDGFRLPASYARGEWKGVNLPPLYLDPREVGAPPPEVAEWYDQTVRWIRCRLPFVLQPLARGYVAALRGIQALGYDEGLEGVVAETIGAFESYALCPCPEHERAAFDLAPLDLDGVTCAENLEHALSSLPNETAWAGLRAELIPWALGYFDPVRERVEARQRQITGE